MYQWLVFVHLAGLVLFLLMHGFSMWAAFGVRRDPRPETARLLLGMPHAYYEQLPDRVGDVGVSIETLEELGIEADRDEEGYLLQIFTRPLPLVITFDIRALYSVWMTLSS